MNTSVEARFISSSPDYDKCPPPVMPEYAFIGRSNVGKSSLINMITGQKMLAKISSTPGKTRLINHFLIDESWYLVDLPGYGYAKTSRSNRKQWEESIEKYLKMRKNLMSSFILLDSRLPLQENDRNMINWFGENQMAFNILLTKSDKLTINQLNANLAAIRRELAESWEELPGIILTSAKTKKGREEILAYIEKTNRLFVP